MSPQDLEKEKIAKGPFLNLVHRGVSFPVLLKSVALF
jgi:hypothetical protein